MVIALKWYLIGATRHNEFNAIHNRDRLLKLLSKEDVEQAKLLAEKWTPNEVIETEIE